MYCTVHHCLRQNFCAEMAVGGMQSRPCCKASASLMRTLTVASNTACHVLPSADMRMPVQQEVLDLVKEGRNVFFTGNAGTGKVGTPLSWDRCSAQIQSQTSASKPWLQSSRLCRLLVCMASDWHGCFSCFISCAACQETCVASG